MVRHSDMLLRFCNVLFLAAALHSTSAGYWTAWLDEDSPDGTLGDYELQARLDTPPCGDNAPSKIRVAMDDVLQVVLETDSLIHVGPRYGLVCKTTDHPALGGDDTSMTTNAPAITGTQPSKPSTMHWISLEIAKWLNVRKRSMKDSEIRKRLVKDSEVRKRSMKDSEIRNRLVKDSEVRKRSMKDSEIQKRLVKDSEVRKRSVKDSEIMHVKVLDFLGDIKGRKEPDKRAVNHCHNFLVCYAHRMSLRLMPQISQWFDMDRPDGAGDYEIAQKHGYFWQTYGSMISFITDDPASSTGSIHPIKDIIHVGPQYGLVCNATEQFTGSCSNYLVQYYCD